MKNNTNDSSMSIANEYIKLAQNIAAAIDVPTITAIHLPRADEEVEKTDKFGFIFLQGGSAGPFYTSLNEDLEELWRLYPDGRSCVQDTMDVIGQLNSPSQALRALALGAFNALSQHVMRRAGYSTLKSPKNSPAFNKLISGETIGMIGFFAPLIDHYIEQNIRVLVLEKNPDRVELKEGLGLSTDPTDLSTCQHILCTASTLINGTLLNILENCKSAKSFTLVGPSASGLPDVLLRHGVDIVAGTLFHDMDGLRTALSAQESWGHTGSKFEIRNDNYPGLPYLLDKIRDSEI